MATDRDESTSQSRKRLFDEFESVSQISPTKCAKVHGIIASVSKFKTSGTGCNYFDGHLTDGEKTVRLVGFDSKVLHKLTDFRERKEPVAILNCEVKEGKWSSELEIHTKKSTDVLKSPTKLDASAIVATLPSGLITLSEMQIKVVSIKEEEEVKNGLIKQDCIIGDTTGTSKVVLWGDNVGVLAEELCYRLSGVAIRSFKGNKYLSVPKDNFDIEEIDDIGAIDKALPDDIHTHTLQNVVVHGVKFFESYNGCYSCKAKVTPISDQLGKCNRCMTMQRIDRCLEQATAKLELFSDSTNEHKVLTCFTPILEKICVSSNTSINSLLFSDKFDLEYSNDGIITTITR